jgi:hypothetical protein
LLEAARFAPDPDAARRLAALPSWPEPGAYGLHLGSGRLASRLPGLVFELQRPRPRRAPAPPPGSYDASILEGRVPTRACNWHDLFNALIWAAFPAAKMALHGRQRELILGRTGLLAAAPSTPQARSRVEDTLAMIDEGGLLLPHLPGAAEATQEAIRREDPGALNLLAGQGALRPLVFGHALLEHLARGHLQVRGFPFAFPVSSLQLSEIDEALAGAVRQVGEPPDRRGLPVPAPFWAAAG